MGTYSSNAETAMLVREIDGEVLIREGEARNSLPSLQRRCFNCNLTTNNSLEVLDHD